MVSEACHGEEIVSVREEWGRGLLRAHRASGLPLHPDRNTALCVSFGVPSPPPSAGLLSSFSQDPSSSASSLPLGFYHLPPFSPPPLSLSPAFLSLSTPPPPSFSFFLPYFFFSLLSYLSIYLSLPCSV